jgi:hypothetical protein
LFWMRRPMARGTPCEGLDDSVSSRTDTTNVGRLVEEL